PLAHLPPHGLQREVLGGEPAGAALPRPHGAGALHPRSQEAQGALYGSDRDLPRREAVGRALPGGGRLRHEPARLLQTARRLPADRVGDDAGTVAPTASHPFTEKPWPTAGCSAVP